MLSYPKIDEQLVERLSPLADRLNDLAESGADCSREQAEFNALAGTSIADPFAFHFSGVCAADAFVRGELARTHIHEFADVGDAQLLALLRDIADGTQVAEETDFWLEVLELNLPGAPISDLLFYPQDALASLGIDISTELTPEEMLRIARAAVVR